MGPHRKSHEQRRKLASSASRAPACAMVAQQGVSLSHSGCEQAPAGALLPYRGAGQAINDLIAGHVRIALLGPTALVPHYKADKLRLLAQSSVKRAKVLPEIPTLEEAGFKGMVLEAWYAAFAPKGTPPAIVARLNAEMGKALADPAMQDSFTRGSMEPTGGRAQDLGRLAPADSENYERLVRELNLKQN